MSRDVLYSVLADAILIVHVAFVGFVVLGLAAVYLGHFRGWSWVRNFWFRAAHLVAISIVVVQSWAGIVCPLTDWEMALRARAGAETYAGSFIQHWLHALLYFDAPDWVFIVVYTLFGALVLGSWYFVRPQR